MEKTIKLSGVIVFEPKNVTGKHERQSKWKRVAVVMLEPELGFKDKGITEYYAWFIEKRYNLTLKKPFRNAHITFISDRISEMNDDWKKVKKKWDGKRVDVVLGLDPRSDGITWWLNIPESDRNQLHGIRAELGLGRPFSGLHMTIGSAVNHYVRNDDDNSPKALNMFEEHSMYIIEMLKNGFCD